MFQTLTWITNAALCLILLTSQPVWADCNSLLEDSKALARDIAVTIEAPVTAPAASPLKITWTNDCKSKEGCSSAAPARSRRRSLFLHCWAYRGKFMLWLR